MGGHWLRRYQQQLGYVPVFVDGSGIEVEGRCFEQAGCGYNGERQYWLHSVFVGVVWVSARLQPDGSDVAGGWQPASLTTRTERHLIASGRKRRC